jgi:hypothetical protein
MATHLQFGLGFMQSLKSMKAPKAIVCPLALTYFHPPGGQLVDSELGRYFGPQNGIAVFLGDHY